MPVVVFKTWMSDENLKALHALFGSQWSTSIISNLVHSVYGTFSNKIFLRRISPCVARKVTDWSFCKDSLQPLLRRKSRWYLYTKLNLKRFKNDTYIPIYIQSQIQRSWIFFWKHFFFRLSNCSKSNPYFCISSVS